VISHDDRYYYLGDRIIKLDYGQIERDADLPAHPLTGNALLDTATKLPIVTSK
jgi:ABC-type siderophore export system fused ATPase/permease subunit